MKKRKKLFICKTLSLLFSLSILVFGAGCQDTWERVSQLPQKLADVFIETFMPQDEKDFNKDNINEYNDDYWSNNY